MQSLQLDILNLFVIRFFRLMWLFKDTPVGISVILIVVWRELHLDFIS